MVTFHDMVPFIAGAISIGWWYSLQLQISIRYYSSKYKISELDLSHFLGDLQFPFTLLFRYSYTEFYTEFSLSGEELISAFRARLGWGFFSFMIPLSFFLVFLKRELPTEKLFFLLVSTFCTILFVISWRFGHSLKSKAQK